MHKCVFVSVLRTYDSKVRKRHSHLNVIMQLQLQSLAGKDVLVNDRLHR